MDHWSSLNVEAVLDHVTDQLDTVMNFSLPNLLDVVLRRAVRGDQAVAYLLARTDAAGARALIFGDLRVGEARG